MELMDLERRVACQTYSAPTVPVEEFSGKWRGGQSVMGVPAPLVDIFLHEHRYRSWRGRLLTLGSPDDTTGRRAAEQAPEGWIQISLPTTN